MPHTETSPQLPLLCQKESMASYRPTPYIEMPVSPVYQANTNTSTFRIIWQPLPYQPGGGIVFLGCPRTGP
jgi:hypothetical protein